MYTLSNSIIPEVYVIQKLTVYKNMREVVINGLIPPFFSHHTKHWHNYEIIHGQLNYLKKEIQCLF